MRSAAREFFEDYVLRSYNDWLGSSNDEYLAKNAVGNANMMAERMWHAYKDMAPHRIYITKSAGDYRHELADVCSDFALVRDVAESHKHVTIRRVGRQVSRNHQTGIGNIGYGEGGYGEGAYGGAEELVVTLDDGTKRALSAILMNVVEMWDRLTAIP